MWCWRHKKEVAPNKIHRFCKLQNGGYGCVHLSKSKKSRKEIFLEKFAQELRAMKK